MHLSAHPAFHRNKISFVSNTTYTLRYSDILLHDGRISGQFPQFVQFGKLLSVKLEFR